ncbi:MAG: hypothetical protein GWP91_03430 [Rhodobacterales bacterium]|nr:hypothetical protein [Rhodobacterales bacterium]
MSLNRDAIVKLLRAAADKGATEIHFKVPSRPLIRVQGSLTPTDLPSLTPRDAQEAVFALCSLAQKELAVANITDESFSFGLNGVGRFRAYVYRQRGILSAIVQRVNTQSPALYELGVDDKIETMVGKVGLLLLCGDNRHALLGALISGYNARIRGHTVVLEAPLNYLYRDAVATIAQREVGVDVPTYATGIRQAIRIGADLLCIGEIEDKETADAVLMASEWGIPIIATVSAPDVTQAEWWISRMFLGEQRSDTERRIKEQLNAIICCRNDQAPEVTGAQPDVLQAG